MTGIHITLSGESRNPLDQEVPLTTYIGVGFGEAIVYRDGKEIYNENTYDDRGFYDGPNPSEWTIADVEAEYTKQPGDYIAWLSAPLWSVIYQRKPEGWRTVYAGKGFADDENAEKDREALAKLIESK